MADACRDICSLKECCAPRKHVLYRQTITPFQCALPDVQNSPPLSKQLSCCSLIPRYVASNLVLPEVFAGRRPAEQCAVMTMPEAAMDENDSTPPWEHKVRLAGKSLHMKSIAVAQSVQPTPDLHLRLCVRCPDTCHHPATYIGRDDVSQRPAFVQSPIAAGQSRASA